MAWAEEDAVANGKPARLHLSGTSRQAAAHTHRHTHSHTRRRLGTHTYPGTRTRTHRRSAPRAFTSGLRSPLAPCVSPEAATSKVEVDGMIPPRTVTDDRVNLNGAE